MNEQNNNTSPAFMEATTRKFADQDKIMGILEEKINRFPNNTEALEKIQKSIDAIRTEAKAGHVPLEKFIYFSSQLDQAIGILKQPVKKEILHHHYIPKLLWISSGLFLILTLVCAGWYNTSSNLDQYIASDTKYRFLRLDTSKKDLQFWLDQVDTFYNTHSDMRSHILETETKYQQNMDRLIRAERLKNEAKDLEKEARQK